MADPMLIDARGMRCPWPALRVARAARDARPGQLLHVAADDPVAPRELAALANARGWGFAATETAVGPGFAIGPVPATAA